MTNTIALTLMLLLIALVAADHYYFRSDMTLATLKHFASLVQALAFWR